MDVTKKDNQEVKNWYKDAQAIKKACDVNSYPTYLFFSPDGKLVNTLGSARTADEFIARVKVAIDPANKFKVLKRQYLAGKRDVNFLHELIVVGQQVPKEFLFVREVTNTYLAKQKNLLTDENLQLLFLATTKSTDPGFPVLMNAAAQVDAKFGEAEVQVWHGELFLRNLFCPGYNLE